MRSGALRHKIGFYALTETQDEMGGITEAETLLCESFASITPISGNEKFIANQLFTEATAQIRCRYVLGITTKHKIKFGSRTFDIINIQNKDERNIEFLLIAKELL